MTQTTPLKDMPDSRPVVQGDLVAAQWYPDPEYYIGIVNHTKEVENFGGWGNVDDAYHLVKLMDAEEWAKLFDDMSQAPFVLLAEKFQMVKTGDFPPESSFAFNTCLKQAVFVWFHYNYPKV